MGKTGECYLVGPDLTMRSRSRFMVEDREAFVASLRRSSLPSATVDQIERQGNVINQLPVRTQAAEEAIRGREGLAILNDYRGVPVLSSYGPLDLDSIRWGVIAEMDVDEAYAPIRAYARHALLAATGLSLGTALLAMVASWLLVRPLRQLTDAARRIGAKSTVSTGRPCRCRWESTRGPSLAALWDGRSSSTTCGATRWRSRRVWRPRTGRLSS
jgi:hypothetical protein